MENRFQKKILYAFIHTICLLIFIFIYVTSNFLITMFQIKLSLITGLLSIIPVVLWTVLHIIYYKSVTVVSMPKVLMKISILIGFVIWTFTLSTLTVNEMNSHFDYNKWVGQPQKRIEMVDNLVDKHQLIGLNKEEIIDLIGSPDETSYFKAANRFVYGLGPERGLMSIDREWLLIDFDNKKRIQKYRIVTD